jgi:hypothetical protein
MYRMGKLVFISTVFAFAIFGLTGIILLTAFAEPKVDLSPTQGPKCPGFNVVINANGFKPNSTVGWKFVGNDSKIPLYGYFATNSTGGFNDVTFADDLKADHYKVYLGDDSNSDNQFDIGAKKVYANLTVYENATTLQCEKKGEE